MDFFAEKNFVAAALAVFSLTFLVFFPHIYASIDEHTFLKNALLLRGGSISEQNPELACRSTLFTSQGFVGSQFIGKSIFLLPFTFFGLGAVMLSGLVIHLINAALFFLILRRLRIDARFSVLYIFFPVMLWESRTLYSELLVLTAFLAAFYFYVRETRLGNAASGFLFGLAAIVRYDAAVGFAAFAAPLVFLDRRKLFEMLAGFTPVVILILLFNAFAYSGPLNAGYGSGVSIFSSLININPLTLLAYTAILLVLVPPGLLASPLLSRKKNYLPQFILISLAYLWLTSRFTDITAFPLEIDTLLTARLRYLVPLIGLLLIPYSELMDKIFGRLKVKRNVLFAALLIVLAGGAVFASSVHANFTGSRFETFSQIKSSVPQDALLIGSSDNCIYSITQSLERTRYMNIVPEYDLGVEGKNISLSERFSSGTYFMDLGYSNRSSNTSQRQENTDAERKFMQDFIEGNKETLEPVFETENPNSLSIYRWKG
ncbi:MAG TPA: hypothetical protein VFF09_01410 [archaeon]|nr:hypothetical protein [archaeon]